MFLLRLAIQADWGSEERCFDTIARELAEFYMVREGATTADALPKELREHAAGAAAESDRGRTSQSQSQSQLQSQSQQQHALQSERNDEPEDVSGVSAVGAAQHRGDEGEGEEGGATALMQEEDTAGSPGKEEEAGGQKDSGVLKEGACIQEGKGVEATVESDAGGSEWRWCVQHVLFPAMRYLLLPPRAFANDGTVVQLVCTSQLYKVFERC
jgi:hypothetical protein